jgi:hypothetical protein
MSIRLKTALTVHSVLGVTGLVLLLASLLFTRSSYQMTCIAFAFGILGIAFFLNGYLGTRYGKMHMQIGSVISRSSRGEKMFKMDIVVQFIAAILSLSIAFGLLHKMLQ